MEVANAKLVVGLSEGDLAHLATIVGQTLRDERPLGRRNLAVKQALYELKPMHSQLMKETPTQWFGVKSARSIPVTHSHPPLTSTFPNMCF